MERSIFDIQAEFCRAMGNATRLQILHILRERSMSVREIMGDLELNQSMVSRQLSVLRSVNGVAMKRSITSQTLRSGMYVIWYGLS